MSHIEAAVKASKKIEGVLRDSFGAEGRGLHEYLSSVEHKIPDDILRKARFIASVRNKVVHHDEEIFDLDDFNNAVEEVLTGLALVLEQERRKKEARNKANISAVPPVDSSPPRSNGFLKFLLLASWAVVAVMWLSEDNSTVKKMLGQGKSIASYKDDILQLERENVALKMEIAKLKNPQRFDPDAARKSSPDLPSEPTVSAPLKEAQRRLAELGYRVGVADGIEGPGTRSAISEFEKANGLPVDGELSTADRRLLFSYAAARARNEAPAQERKAPALGAAPPNSLLDKAKASEDEFSSARHEISVDLVNLIRTKTKVSLGEPEVTQAADGTYDVRVPVSWSAPMTSIESLLGKYFTSGSSARPPKGRGDGKEIQLRKRDAELSSSPKPYSGRLFNDLLNIESTIVVSLGAKSASLLIAGQFRCFVSCNYQKGTGDDWIIRGTGKPGDYMLVFKQESPVVIKGLTEMDLRNGAMPFAQVR